jgi:hypothetical protein
LRGKLVLAFVSISLVPTLLLFYVSASIINVSIKRWFDTQVETFLEESLDVARTSYKNSEANAVYYARQISSVIKDRGFLNEQNSAQLEELVREKQKEYNWVSCRFFFPAGRTCKVFQCRSSSGDSQVLGIFSQPFSGKELRPG